MPSAAAINSMAMMRARLAFIGAKPPRAMRRHADMVFLIGRGRHAVDARRMRQLLVLAHQRRGGALRDHEAGIEPGIADEERRQQRDRRNRSARRCAVSLIEPISAIAMRNDVGGEGDGLGMEIAARKHRAILGKDQRIVGDAIGLDDKRARRIGEEVEAGAHHLRLAAEGIGILHPVIAGRDARRGWRCPP